MTSVEELIGELSPAPDADAVETAGLDAIRAALESEISGEPGARVRRRAGRAAIALRSIPVAAGCLVAVAVIAVALTVLRHHATDRSLTGPAAGPAADALIGRLAVLRRPQTAADRLPADLVVNQAGSGGPPRSQLGVIIPSLTRLVATRPGAKLYLVVTTPSRGPEALWSASHGDQVAIVAITPRGATQSQGYPAAELQDSRELILAGLILSPNPSARGRATAVRQSYDVAIVPDGIARVRWTFADRGGHPGRELDAPVANNVAIAPYSQTTFVLLTATWYSPTGRKVPATTAALEQAIAAKQAKARRDALAQAEREQTTAPARLLAAFAVFSYNSPTGTRTPDGYLIAHPPLSKLPLPILNGPGRQPLDLRQARSVRAPSGLQMWVMPGLDGICVFETDNSTRLPYGRAAQGSAGSCSPDLQSAIPHGAGLSADNAHGATVYGVVPRTVPNVEIQLARSRTRTIHPAAGVYIAQTPFHFG